MEDEGLSTVVVALVREHAEKMRPPRALWVPFELGRPFGAPNAAEFQTRVLRAALALLDHPQNAAVLEDFPDDAVESAADSGWLPPSVKPATDLQAEVSLILPLWERARETRKGTTFGISGLSPEQAVDYVARFFSENPMENPPGMAKISRARFAIDDIKCFYFEAATSSGSSPSTKNLNDWFWQQTQAGQLVLNFQKMAAKSADTSLNQIKGSLVPAERVRVFR